MKALIVGAGGQIGSELAGVAQRAGHEVWMLDRARLADCAGYPVLAKSFDAHPGLAGRWLHPETGVDAADPAAMDVIFAALRPDLVYHMAAVLSAKGEENPPLAWRVNVESLRIALEALSRYRRADGAPPVLVCPSSIAAYGPVEGMPKVLEEGLEAGPLEPRTMYGVTKIVAERLGEWFARHMPQTAERKRVDFRSLRFPGLLSAVPPGGGSSDYANKLFFAAAENRAEVEIFVRPDARIPFMYMPDALRALITLAQAPAAKLTRRTYNIAAFSPTAEEIAREIQKHLNHKLKVIYKPDRRQEFVDSWPRGLQDQTARRDWGWRPEYGLAETTKVLLAECREVAARQTPAPGSA